MGAPDSWSSYSQILDQTEKFVWENTLAYFASSVTLWTNKLECLPLTRLEPQLTYK